jgi:hypothetical protein
LNNLLYYAGVLILVVGFFVGLAWALRARREAREGVDLGLTSEADMLSEFQRAREAGEMDEAEFRRVRDLLISGKGSKGGEHHETRPSPGLEDHPPADPPPESPAPGGPG